MPTKKYADGFTVTSCGSPSYTSCGSPLYDQVIQKDKNVKDRETLERVFTKANNELKNLLGQVRALRSLVNSISDDPRIDSKVIDTYSESLKTALGSILSLKSNILE